MTRIPVVEEPYGWVIVGATTMISCFGNGFTFILGVFYVSWLDDFNRSAALTLLVVSLPSSLVFIFGIASPLIVERLGCRLTVIICGFILSCAYFAASFVPSIQLLMLCMATSGCATGCVYNASITIVTRYFEKRRSLAVSLCMMGMSIAILGLAPLARLLISVYNWRGAMLIFSAISLHIVVCGALLRPKGLPEVIDKLITEPCSIENDFGDEEYDAILEDDDSDSMSNGAKLREWSPDKPLPYSPTLSHSIRELAKKTSQLLKPALLLLVIAQTLNGAGIMVPLLLIVGSAMSEGVSFTDASLLMTMLGVVAIPGRLGIGWLADRKFISRRNLYVILTFICGVNNLLRPLFNTYSLMAVHVIIFGVTYSPMISLFVVLVSDYMGAHNISAAFGICSLGMGIGTAVAPTIGGWLYDISGTYTVAFCSAGVSLLLSSLCVLLLRFTETYHKLDNPVA